MLTSECEDEDAIVMPSACRFWIRLPASTRLLSDSPGSRSRFASLGQFGKCVLLMCRNHQPIGMR
jgi:hypothetical protein